MSIIGLIDIDIHIISFCDLKTIKNLLFLENLIEQAISDIVEINKNEQENLIYFVIDLIEMNEIVLAKKFIVEIEKTIQNLNEYYYYIIVEDFRENVITIHLSVDSACDGIIKYFRDYLNDQLSDHLGDCSCDIINFYQIAIDSKNIKLLKFLLDYCDNEDFIFYCEEEEESSYEEDNKDSLTEIKDFNNKAKEILKNYFILTNIK